MAGCGDGSGSCDANAGCSAGVEGGARKRRKSHNPGVATGGGNTACGGAGGSGGDGDMAVGFGALGGSTGSGGRGAAPGPCGVG